MGQSRDHIDEVLYRAKVKVAGKLMAASRKGPGEFMKLLGQWEKMHGVNGVVHTKSKGPRRSR